MSIPLPPIKNIPLDKCVEMDSPNPNVLGPERYELLVKGIRTNGFVQPILVYEQDGEFVVVDGVHRVKAAREIGMPEVSAVIAGSPEHAKLLRLALNKLRGELDQTIVGADLLELSELFEISELTLSGYTDYEVDALLDIAKDDGSLDHLLAGASVQVEEEVRPKTYNLTLKFESESQRALVKEWLAQPTGLSPEAIMIQAVNLWPVSKGDNP